MVARKIPNPIDEHVGARVRMRRKMVGMSQEKLAYAIGVTFQQVQKYEKGTNRMGASRVQQIAHALQVSPAFFFEGPAAATGQAVNGFAEEPHPAYVTDLLTTSHGLALCKAFIRIQNPKLQRRIVNLVKQMVRDAEQP